MASYRLPSWNKPSDAHQSRPPRQTSDTASCSTQPRSGQSPRLVSHDTDWHYTLLSFSIEFRLPSFKSLIDDIDRRNRQSYNTDRTGSLEHGVPYNNITGVVGLQQPQQRPDYTFYASARDKGAENSNLPTQSVTDLPNSAKRRSFDHQSAAMESNTRRKSLRPGPITTSTTAAVDLSTSPESLDLAGSREKQAEGLVQKKSIETSKAEEKPLTEAELKSRAIHTQAERNRRSRIQELIEEIEANVSRYRVLSPSQSKPAIITRVTTLEAVVDLLKEWSIGKPTLEGKSQSWVEETRESKRKKQLSPREIHKSVAKDPELEQQVHGLETQLEGYVQEEQERTPPPSGEPSPLKAHHPR